MKVEESLVGVTRLFLDTAPVIYYVEQNPLYLPIVEIVFDRILNGLIMAVASPVTIAECLVQPYRFGQTSLQREYIDLILDNDSTFVVSIDEGMAIQAAQLRAKYNLQLPDAFQVSAALAADFEAFLTNDVVFRRVTEIRAIALEDLEV